MNASMPVGERLRFFRARRSSVSIAGLAGISVDYLAKLERSERLPSMPVLIRLAQVLGVSISALVAEPITESTQPSPWGAELARAMVEQPDPERSDQPDLPALRGLKDSVTLAWRTAPDRYTRTGSGLPGLVRATVRATRWRWTPGEASERREAHRIAAEVYETARHFSRETGRPDLGLIASERQVAHAEQADDPLRIALGRWSQGHAIAASGDPGAMEVIAQGALAELEPETHRTGSGQLAALQMSGMLQMQLALAAGRQGDHWRAQTVLRDQAGQLAHRTGSGGSGQPFWLSFDQPNVSIWTACVLVEAGESAEAIRITDGIDLDQVASIERRATALLQVAQAHQQRGDDSSTLLMLLRLEREAPEDCRHRGVAHELVRGLLHRVRATLAPEARGLAGRMGLVASA